MPRPVAQILSGQKDDPKLIAIHQEEYQTLPSMVGEWPCFATTSRWTFTPEERARIAAGGDLWLTQLTFGHPLQPVMLRTEEPTREEIMKGDQING